MATVVQIVATDADHPYFDADLTCSEDWHAVTVAGDTYRTVCGVQLEGNDGYAPDNRKQGRVTCEMCRLILEDIQSIKRWR